MNPYATHPLPEHVLPFRRWVPRNGKMEKLDGITPGKLLGLPEDWPGERTPDLAQQAQAD